MLHKKVTKIVDYFKVQTNRAFVKHSNSNVYCVYYQLIKEKIFHLFESISARNRQLSVTPETDFTKVKQLPVTTETYFAKVKQLPVVTETYFSKVKQLSAATETDFTKVK